MKTLIISLVLLSSNLLAFNQSDPEIEWSEINTENFKIVYPSYLKDKAIETLNYLEFYRPIVSKDYKMAPKKLDLILRPMVASPNGFVTYAPRRSEWFINESTSQFLGTLNWYQTLAIHEYRHVVQLDYLSKGTTRFVYYAFGEQLLSIINYIVSTPWFLEGDAVYAETIYSDSGRGRSPRFSARFKALILSDNPPTFDELLAGDFEKNSVNHYVFGYYLVTYAVKKFGEDFWQKVARNSSNRPWNIFSFYTSFEELTGITIDEFYDDMIKDLKKKWTKASDSFIKTRNEVYENTFYPRFKNADLYYFKKELNSYTSLFKNNNKITDLNVDLHLSSYDIDNSELYFTRIEPHPRYSYLSYSNLFKYNTKTNTETRITNKERIFHPRVYQGKVSYIFRNEREQICLNINKKIHCSKEYVPIQFEQINENHFIILAIRPSGKRVITLYNYKNDTYKNILTPTRNNLYNISHHNNLIYFEADYKGKIQVFSLNLSGELKICTDELVAAYMPRAHNEKLYYTYESAQGNRLKSKTIDCKTLNPIELTDTKKYLSKSPSDNYFNKKPVNSIVSKNIIDDYSQSSHNRFKSLLRPHSWSFIGGRGYQLSAISQNNLSDMQLGASIGERSVGGKNFYNLSFNYMKYYPIIGLEFDNDQRSNLEDSWIEDRLSASVTLPYTSIDNLYQVSHYLEIKHTNIKVSENDFKITTRLNDEILKANKVSLFLSKKKAMKKQEIQPSMGADLALSYTDIINNENEQENYIGEYDLSIYLPGIKENHGSRFKFSGSYRAESFELYYLNENYLEIIETDISRGHLHEDSYSTQKSTFEYVLPLSYPRENLKDWLYINRFYSRVFIDHTIIKNFDLQKRTLSSYGIEFIFDTNTMRKIPLTYGIRHAILDGHGTSNWGFFIELPFGQ